MAPRILIADDQEMILKALRRLLERNARFEVCGTAENGSEAVVKAQEVHPDLVILDLAMPIMNGMEAAQEISKVQPNTPILLYTMTDAPQVGMEAAKAGIREVIGKSAAPQLLLAAIERALKRETPAAVPTANESELRLTVTAAETGTATPAEHPDFLNNPPRAS
jgi:DNA-binding NarL/FixJ family response regulator